MREGLAEGWTVALRPGALYEVRKDLDISRDELARRMGLASSSAYRVESGRTQPGTAFIAGLVAVSGRKFEDLFTLEPRAS